MFSVYRQIKLNPAHCIRRDRIENLRWQGRKVVDITGQRIQQHGWDSLQKLT